MFEKTKRYFLILSLLCSIFTHIEYIKNDKSSEKSEIKKKINYVKDITTIGHDILSGNFISLTIHFFSYFKRIKKMIRYVRDKLKKNEKG
jgi:hypothetical protein